MRGDKVDAGLRCPAAVIENFARSGQALGQRTNTGTAGQPEGAHIIAETVVPFAPAERETSEVITVRAQIPRLGDQLDAREQRILTHGGEEVAIARQGGGEVETEAIDVHFAHPVAQRIHHQLQRTRVREVEGIAAAAEIFVVTGIVRAEAIVAGVVDAAEGNRRAVFVAFCRVVEHHVENDFQTGRMQRTHHRTELGDDRLPVAARRIARLRGKETEGVVAPVVASAIAGQMFFVEEIMHRQQVDGGNSQAPEMVEHRR